MNDVEFYELWEKNIGIHVVPLLDETVIPPTMSLRSKWELLLGRCMVSNSEVVVWVNDHNYWEVINNVDRLGLYVDVREANYYYPNFF